MLSTIVGFCEGRVIVRFLRRRPQVFPWVWMNLKRSDILLGNKISVIRWYLFFFFACFCWRGKMGNTSGSSLRSFHICRKLNGGRECKVLNEEKSKYSRIAFCVNLAQLFIISYLTTPWKMLPSKNSRVLICFNHVELLMKILILFI